MAHTDLDLSAALEDERLTDRDCSSSARNLFLYILPSILSEIVQDHFVIAQDQTIVAQLGITIALMLTIVP